MHVFCCFESQAHVIQFYEYSDSADPLTGKAYLMNDDGSVLRLKKRLANGIPSFEAAFRFSASWKLSIREKDDKVRVV